MQFKIYFLLSILLLFACSNNGKKNAQKITNYPTFYEIIYEFFSDYSVPQMEIESQKLYIDFEKNAKGVEVVIKEYDKENGQLKEIERHHFWDINQQKYNELELPESNIDPNKESIFNNNKVNFGNHANKGTHINYDLHYYYGYPDWNHDFQVAYGSYEGDNNQIRYTLAQSYLSEIFNYSMYNQNEKKEVTEKDWESAIEGIDIMEEMLKEEVPINTMIGGLKNKISNDIIGIMYVNKFAGWSFNEQNLLERVCYDKTYLETIKLYLTSCPQNTILITSGDNDTYPLLYAQWKLGIREDITIINSSLLNVMDYFKYIVNHHNLNYEIDPDALEERQIQYAYIDPSIDGYKNFEDFKKDCMTNTKHGAPIVASKIAVNQKDTVFNLNWKSRLLFMSDIRLIDLLSNNSQPFCFTQGSHNFKKTPDAPLHDWAVYSLFGKVSKEEQIELALKNLKSLSDIDPKKIYRFDEFFSYVVPFNSFYFFALKTLGDNNQSDELVKYTQKYFEILSPEENINKMSALSFHVIKDHPATATIARDMAEIGQASIYNIIRNKISDPNWTVDDISQVSDLVGLLQYFDRFLDIPYDKDFQDELIAFFDGLYEQKPHFIQVVINYSELHSFIASK